MKLNYKRTLLIGLELGSAIIYEGFVDFVNFVNYSVGSVFIFGGTADDLPGRPYAFYESCVLCA